MKISLSRRNIFMLIMIGCGLFVVLTVIAMLAYPGGTYSDFNTRGYSFFQNFFSELGLLRTHTGEPKTVSLVLFVIAMILSGTGMIAFFTVFPLFFQTTTTNGTLSLFGSGLGIVSGICFIGVAAAPADVNLSLHGKFVIWAFRLFPVAVLCYAIVLFREKTYPRRYAWELVVFLLLLVGYLVLLEYGPKIGTFGGMVIQAVGQKIVVYASIASVMIQCWGAMHHPHATPGSQVRK